MNYTDWTENPVFKLEPAHARWNVQEVATVPEPCRGRTALFPALLREPECHVIRHQQQPKYVAVRLSH